MIRYKIDFSKINVRLPLAFDVLVNWYSLSHMMSNSACYQILLGDTSNVITNRRLYEFFDAHLICVNIVGEVCENGIQFTFNVNNEGLIGDYSSRLECEFNAFTRAFEIMNNEILKDEKGAA